MTNVAFKNEFNFLKKYVTEKPLSRILIGTDPKWISQEIKNEKWTDLQTNVEVFAKLMAFFSDNCTSLPPTHRDGGLANMFILGTLISSWLHLFSSWIRHFI